MALTLNFNRASPRGLYLGKYKYIDLPFPELYDIEADFDETPNLWEIEPDLFDRENVINELVDSGIEYEEVGNTIQVFKLNHETAGRFKSFMAQPRSATLEDVFFRLTGRSLQE